MALLFYLYAQVYQDFQKENLHNFNLDKNFLTCSCEHVITGFAQGFFFSFATIFANLIFFVPFSLTLSQILSQILAIFRQRIILSEKKVFIY